MLDAGNHTGHPVVIEIRRGIKLLEHCADAVVDIAVNFVRGYGFEFLYEGVEFFVYVFPTAFVYIRHKTN